MLHVFYMIAIFAEAMTAALVAGRRQMDWLGVCVLACVTALGGGSLRDVLLGHYPLSWVAHPENLLVVIGGALFAGLTARYMRRLRTVFLVLDALGLVVFTIIGCDVALQLGVHWGIVLLSGMITGTFGGVLRDMLCAQVPLLFRQELYASVGLLTAGIYLAAPHVGLSMEHGMFLALGIGFTLRLFAIFFEWEMPKFVYSDDWE